MSQCDCSHDGSNIRNVCDMHKRWHGDQRQAAQGPMMTLENAKEAREKAERDIMTILKEFESKTGLMIQRACLSSETYISRFVGDKGSPIGPTFNITAHI